MDSYWDITSEYCSATAEKVAVTVWILVCIALLVSVGGGVALEEGSQSQRDDEQRSTNSMIDVSDEETQK